MKLILKKFVCLLFLSLVVFGNIAYVKATNSDENFGSPDFVVNVGDITGIESKDLGGPKGIVNSVFQKVINLLLGVIGISSLFVMVVGAGYMIFFVGNENNLGKGKKMFWAGLAGLAVALLSYYIISIVDGFIRNIMTN